MHLARDNSGRIIVVLDPGDSFPLPLSQAPNKNLLGAYSVILTEHFQVHEGNHFICDDYDTINATEVKGWLVVAPAGKDVHLDIVLNSYFPTTSEVFEDPTVAPGDEGTPLPTYNSDRNSGLVSPTEIYEDPTPTDDGTRISVTVIGGGRGVGRRGGMRSREDEVVLKRGSMYLIRITSADDNNDISMSLSWYEV